MTVPDYISPLVAYRVWQWDAIGLKSLNNEPWVPGETLKAKCRAVAALAHEAPEDPCSCGIYAAKDFNHLRQIGYLGYGVHGEVYLWGTVVEHRLGWRAQFAYPKNLVLPPDTVPFKLSEAESRLEALAAYGADISILSKAGNIPLWAKASGYDPAGLDWLVEQRKKWYELRALGRVLKHGDRVAVLGRGIGVVASADSGSVEVLMWNKSILRLLWRQITWNRRNWRWEADGTGTFARSGVLATSCR